MKTEQQRTAIEKDLEAKYKVAAAVVNGGDWSQEALDRATAARMCQAGYSSWRKTAKPGESHPTEEYY